MTKLLGMAFMIWPALPYSPSFLSPFPPPCSQKSMYKFWLHQNLTTNNLLLSWSLTKNINSWLTRILHVTYIIHFVLKISYREKTVCFQIVANLQKNPINLFFKNPHDGPTLIRPVLFKNQLHVSKMNFTCLCLLFKSWFSGDANSLK